jgi:hypothetical protein
MIMKRTLRLIMASAFSMMMTAGFAQSNYSLTINHKLNAYDFGFGEYGMTTDSTIFSLTRLEYYLSEITITHDGGQETTVPDLWVLVRPNNTTVVDLGSQSITAVESVSFSVGVDPAHNHLDPSTYGQGHPLANKNPSMHWGWTAGYRFVAIEGEDYNETNFQVHALGDVNYFETTVETSATTENGVENITVYANYSRAFDGIDITKGLINHGETDEAVDLLLNFNEFVFSALAPTDSFSLPGDNEPNGIEVFANNMELSVAPNPAVNNEIRFNAKSADVSKVNVQLFDITGKLAYEFFALDANQTQRISNLNSGLYFLNVTDVNGSFSTTQRVVVK